jgi:hypothetical protein
VTWYPLVGALIAAIIVAYRLVHHYPPKYTNSRGVLVEPDRFNFYCSTFLLALASVFAWWFILTVLGLYSLLSWLKKRKDAKAAE